MPRKLRIDEISAELAEVKSLILGAQQVGDYVGELQYTNKYTMLSEELNKYSLSGELAASVALFFGGKPVIGSSGIKADFAGKILNDFQELINKVFANIEFGVLGKRGRVSHTASSQLMITHIAKGSFGFVLDEISEQNDLTETALKTVVDEVADLIEKTAAVEQTGFDAILGEIDNRTLISLRDFFSELDKNDATLRLVEGDREYFLDESSVQRGRERTENLSIEETSEELVGVLSGFLPDHKKFELNTNEGVSIFGSVSQAAAEAYANMLQSGNIPINKMWKVKVNLRTVKPINGVEKLRYKLLEFITLI